jgi:hypothetical protein
LFIFEWGIVFSLVVPTNRKSLINNRESKGLMNNPQAIWWPTPGNAMSPAVMKKSHEEMKSGGA